MEAWLAQFGWNFVNPGFLVGGTALVASPIIIHLINRMRFRRVRFAAMEFLLVSQKRSRRRILFQQLLLLLLRIFIVLALLALIARLIIDPNQLSLIRGTKVHHIVLLDDSGSMRNQWGETVAFQEAIDVVKKLVAEGARRPDTQKFTLILLSDPHNTFGQPQRDINDKLVTDLEANLKSLECSHQDLNLVDGLDAARERFADEKATVKHLHVISDFRASDWRGEHALGRSIRALEKDGEAGSGEGSVSVNLVKTVPERLENLAVTELSGDLQSAAAGFPMRLKVGVKNFGSQVVEDVRLSIVLDGQKRPGIEKFKKIEPGSEGVLEFYATFDKPGRHQVYVQLAADSLIADNTRYLAIEVAETNRVLIIDGDPIASEGVSVSDAFAGLPGVTEFSPLIENVDYLRRHPLEKFRCIYMVNVAELPGDALEPLYRYVEDGGGLVWFLGDLVSPAFYNDKLYRNGNGIFPVPLASSRRDLPLDDPTQSGPDMNLSKHPIFGVFEGVENPFLEITKIERYLPVADTWVIDDDRRTDNVTTIAVLRDKQPLLFEHTYGQGRIITFLSSAGPSWNNWSKNRSYIIFQIELAKYVLRSDRTIATELVGREIVLSLDPSSYTRDVQIVAPGNRIRNLQAAPVVESKKTSASSSTPNNTKKDNSAKSGSEKSQKASGNSDGGDATLSESRVRLVSTFRETDAPGIYSVKLLDQDQRPETRLIAYNVSLRESELELADNDQIRRQIGEDVRVEIQEPGSFQWLESKDADQDVRNLLLFLLVVALLAEQFLAYRMSYHPRVVKPDSTAGVLA